MNYSKILSSIILISTCISAHESLLIEKTVIAQKVVTIETRMARERYVVHSLTALSIAQSIYPWIVLYKGSPGSAEQPKRVSFIEASKAAFNNLFYTQEGWVSMVNAGISLGGSMVISKVCDKFIHPDTLRWYVHSHAPYAVTIQMMKDQLVLLQNESCGAQQIADSKKFLHLLYDRLVHQGESMCAYMAYKVQRLDDEEKALAKRAANSMFVAQNNWLQRISDQLLSDTINYHIIDALLVAYEADVAYQLNHFSVIEGETLHDQHVVKQLIKRSLV
jgi:hypothetical protein